MNARHQGFVLLTVVIFLSIVAFALILIGEQGAELRGGIALTQDEASMSYLMQAGVVHAISELRTKGCSNYGSVAGGFGDASYTAAFSNSSGSPLGLVVDGTLHSGRHSSLTRPEVRSYGSSTLTTIVVTNATYIDEAKPDQTKGDDAKLRVTEAATHDHRVLMSQDLSVIPAGARIDRAELILEITKTQATQKVKVERLTQVWVEDEASWVDREKDRSWSTAGGSVTGKVYATFVTDAATVAVDITTLVDEWHRGVPNYGMLFSYIGTTSADTDIASDDETDILLNVYYSCECGETCAIDNQISCDANFRPNTKRYEFSSAITSHVGVTGVPGNSKAVGVTFPEDGGQVVASTSTLYAYDKASKLLGSCKLDRLDDDISGLTYVTGGDYAGMLALAIKGKPQILVVDAACDQIAGHVLEDSALSDLSGLSFLTLAPGSKHEHHFAVTDDTGAIELIDADFTVTSTIDPVPSFKGVTGLVHVPNQERFLSASNDTKAVHTVNFSGVVESRYDAARFGLEDSGGIGVDLTSCDHLLAQGGGSDVAFVYQEPLSTEPLAHWKLDETTGETAIDSVGGHDGKVIGLPVLGNPGAVQEAITLAGSQYVSVPDAPELNLPKEFTIAAWIRPDTVADFRVIASKGYSTSQNIWLGLADGYPMVVYHDGTYRNSVATAPLAAGAWHHIAYSYSTNSGQISIYVDGALVHKDAAGGALTVTNEPVLIGRSWSGGQFEGRIDDVYLFDSELPSQDVELLFAEGDLTNLGGGSNPPPDPTCKTLSYADDFESGDFSGNTGSIDFPSDWLEVGESDGVYRGDIRTRSSGGNRYMRIRDNNNGGEGISRQFDLAGFSSATLSIDYARIDLFDPHYISVLVETTDGTAELGLIQEVDGVENDSFDDFQRLTFDLDRYLGGKTILTLVTSASMPNTSGAGIDNIQIEGCP